MSLLLLLLLSIDPTPTSTTRTFTHTRADTIQRRERQANLELGIRRLLRIFII